MPPRWALPLVLVVASACLAPAPRLAPPLPGEPTKTIWIVGHRLHTGIVVKRADVPAGMWPEVGDFPYATYLEVGWGDRDYYQAARPTLALALRAALRSRGTVLHVAGFDAPAEAFFRDGDLVEVDVPRGGFDALSRFIHDSHVRDGRGGSIRLGPGAYGQSYFYLAEGAYGLSNNCNHWAARAIAAAGCAISPGPAFTPRYVIAQVSSCGRVLR